MTEPTTFDAARDRRMLRFLDVISKPTTFAARFVRPLSAETSMDTARRLTGLHDFGFPDITEAVERLVAPLAVDGDLTDLGELIERDKIRRLLMGRLQVVDHLQRNPDIARAPLDRPIFLVGLPRTGTTLLQHVIASHPEVRAVEGWESRNPLPEKSVKARKSAYRTYLATVRLVVPHSFTVHPMEPEGPEEGLEIIDRTFFSRHLAFFGDPGYGRWLDERSRDEMIAAYRIYVDQLRMLVHQRPEGRLLVKSPALLGLHNVLAHHMPDATFISTHRDLRQVIPSVLSLWAVARTATHRVDPVKVGHRLLGEIADMTAAFEKGLEGVDADRFIDVRYTDLVEDVVKVCADVFDRLGLSIPDDLESRVSTIRDGLRDERYGRHRYSLEQFGLQESDFADVADEYAERFGLTAEQPRS